MSDEVSRLLEENAALRLRVAELEARSTDSSGERETPLEIPDLFTQMLDALSAVFWMRSADAQRLIYVSPNVQRLTGRTPAELYRHPQASLEMLHREDRPVMLQALGQLAAGDPQAPRELIYRMMRTDGELRLVQDQLVELRDASGRVIHHAGLARDVTDQHLAQQKLRESDARLNAALNHVPVDFWICDEHGRCILQNATAQRNWGQLEGKLPEDWGLPPEMLQRWRDNSRRVLSGQSMHYEFRYDHGPRPQWFEVVLAPLYGRDAEKEIVHGIVGVNTNVTDRKLAQLWQTDLGRLLEDSLHEVFVFDQQTLRFVSVNRGARQNLGYTMQELEQMTPLEVMPGFAMPALEELLEPLKSARQRVVEFSAIHRRQDGSHYPVDVHLHRSTFADREVYVASVQDVTQRERSREHIEAKEAQLRHVSRLSTLGELMAGITHEVNQPLYAIANFAGTCLNELDKSDMVASEALRGWIEDIAGAAHRAAAVIQRIRRFAQRGRSDYSQFDLRQMLEESRQIVEIESGRDQAAIEFHPASADAQVQGDRVQLQQVVVNLLHNALEAVRANPPGQRRIVVRIFADVNRAQVSVADNGCGLPPDQDGETIFEPFVTTRPQGLGMGLAISRSIIDSHGGRLWAEPQAKGATFHFDLPITTGKG